MRWIRKRAVKRPVKCLQLVELENRVTPATFTVTNLNNSGLGSLRQAVLDANTAATDDSINIAVSGNIILSSELTVTDDVIITGLSPSQTLLNGNFAGRIFNITSGSATTVILSNMTLVNGKAATGGAIQNNAKLTLSDVVMYNNSATDDGGAVYSLANSALSLSRTELTTNGATDSGGAIFTTGTVSVSISNCTIGDNTAGGTGGAFTGFSWSTSCSFTMQNTTVTKNTAAGNGGAFRVQAGGADLNMFSSVVSGNFGPVAAPDIFAGTVNATKSLIGNQTGFTFGTNSNNLPPGTDPQLGSLVNNGGNGAFSYLPAKTSPLRDAGSNSGGFTMDARGPGYPRVMNAIADIGAVEVFDLTVTNSNNAGAGSLRQQVLDSANRVGSNTIAFDSTYFSTAKTIFLNTPIALTDDVLINAPTNRLLTLDGSNLVRHFDIGNIVGGSATLKNLNLTNGFNASDGGSIRMGAASILNLESCTITNCQSPFGGAISNGGNNFSEITLDSCTLQNNTANTDGGALWNTGILTVRFSTIANNTATTGNGGGMVTGPLTLESSSIHDNTAANRGGGLSLIESPTGLDSYIHNSTVARNKAGSGGAISVGQSGNFVGNLLIRNSTIVHNTANIGGAIITTFAKTGFTTTLFSTVLSNNTASTGPDISSNYPVEADYCAIGTNYGYNLTGSQNLPFGIDYKFGSLNYHGGETKNYRPDLDSPLVGQGSVINGLTPLDQRGFSRNVNGVDIGAVELSTASIVSISRNTASPTTDSAVSWTVKLSNSLTSLGAIGNATLTGSGKTGAFISSVTGSGTTWTVSALTGAEGSLTLNFIDDNGYDRALSNLPFAGESYIVNKVALGATITASHTMLTDANAGTGTFTLTAAYTEAMNTASTPSFSFPTVGENPGASLAFQNGSWTDNKTYAAKYNVADLGLSMATIDVQVSGGSDEGGLAAGTFSKTDLFSIDTRNPTALSIQRMNPIANNFNQVQWLVTFSESVPGISSSNFSLFNGGLTGTPAIGGGITGTAPTQVVTASTGGGAGTLTLVIDNGVGVTDVNGNPLVNTPLSGGTYDIDHIAPAASKLTLSTLVVADANVGPNGFTATLRYNELMNQAVNPTVSFPAEYPASLTFNSGVWLDARTYQAKFNVADLGVTQSDINIQFTGGEDLAGNVQAVFNAVDVFDIDTQNPIIGSITSTTPDGTYGAGQVINITLNFSEQVELLGMMNVTLDTGAVVNISGPQSGTSLNGTYIVGANDSSPDLNVTAIALTAGSTLRDEAMNNSVLTPPASNLANNANIIVGSTGPVVTGITVNNNLTQRSRLTTIAVNFSTPVNAATLQTIGAITLTRTTGIVGTIVDTSNGLLVNPASGLVPSVTLTFTNTNTAGINYGSLTDGRWRLAIPALNYQSGLNDPNLRRLFGDGNADGTVDGNDLAAFGAQFGQTLPNSPFDFNADGTVDALDFGELGNRFGLTL